MSRETFEDALANCLDQMQAGGSIDECVASYPQYADELRAQLHFAQSLRGARPRVQPEPSVGAQHRSRLLTAVGEQREAASVPVFGLLAPLGTVLAVRRWRLSLLPQALPAVVALLLLGGAALGVSAATGSADPTARLRNLFVSSDEGSSDGPEVACADLEDDEAQAACEEAVAEPAGACADIDGEAALDQCEEAVDLAGESCDELDRDARHACEEELDALEDAADEVLDVLEDACDDLEDEAAEEACEDALGDEDADELDDDVNDQDDVNDSDDAEDGDQGEDVNEPEDGVDDQDEPEDTDEPDDVGEPTDEPEVVETPQDEGDLPDSDVEQPDEGAEDPDTAGDESGAADEEVSEEDEVGEPEAD